MSTKNRHEQSAKTSTPEETVALHHPPKELSLQFQVTSKENKRTAGGVLRVVGAGDGGEE